MTKFNDVYSTKLSDAEKFDTLLSSLLRIEKEVACIKAAQTLSLTHHLNQLYDPRETSGLLKVSYSTVLEWIKDGKMEPIKGTKYKIAGWELLRFVQMNKRYGENLAKEFGFLGLYNGQSPTG